MQEVVDSLTQQKLSHTIRINDLDKANSTLLADLSKLRDEHNVAVQASINMNSIKAELQRLSLENTELIVTNKKLEVALKKSDDKLVEAMEFAENESNYVQLKDKFDKLVEDQQNLEKINIDLTSKNDQLNINERKLTKSMDDQNHLLNICKYQESKLQLYKTKLIDFSAQLKQLKSCKEVLLKTVNEYSVAVSKWQSEILIVSNEFFEKNRLLRKENKVLKVQQNEADESINKLTTELKARDLELEQYKEKYTQLLNEFDLLQKEKEKISTLLETLRSDSLDGNQDDELKTLKDLLNQAEQHCVQYKANLENQTVLHKQNEELILKEYSGLTKDIEIAMSKYNDSNELVKELRNELENLKEEIDIQKSSANESLQQANQRHVESERSLSIQIADLQNQLAVAQAESASELMALSKAKDFENISSELECKTRALDELTQELAHNDKILRDTIQTKDKLFQSKVDELADLLSEMRELNEALKTRGDVISQQEQSITELEILIAAKSAEAEHLTERINELERIVHTNDTNNDQLSTSTVSRVEEMARMRDIDDSFEEKYNRLRAVAIKLKKKVAEQTKLLTDLELKNNRNSDEEVQITSKLGNIEVQVRNLQLLQSENDRLQDKLEAIELERKEFNVTVAKLSAELANVKSSSADTVSDVMASNKQKNALEQACKEYVKQIQALKDEINAGKVTHKALNEELNKLKGNFFTALFNLIVRKNKRPQNKIKSQILIIKMIRILDYSF